MKFLIDGVIHDKQLNSYQAKRMSGLESNTEKTIIGTEMGEEIVRYFSLSCIGWVGSLHLTILEYYFHLLIFLFFSFL